MLSPVRRLRPASRAALVLLCLVAATQLAALVEPALRRPALFGSVVLLDALGAVFSFRAVRRSTKPWPWRLIGLARTAAVLSFGTLLWYVQSGNPAGYWTGVVLRFAELALLAAATFASRLAEIRGRNRWSFGAEVTIVVSAGAMCAWYFVLSPALGGGSSSADVVRLAGYVAGDLLMLAAVGALVLGGTAPRLTHPRSAMIAGLVLLLVTDIAWNAAAARGAEDMADIWPLAAGMVAAGLLLTLAPLIALAQAGREPAPPRRTAWSQALVPLALLAGAGLMITATIREKHLNPWGGLVVCLLLMVVAVMVHMTVSLRLTRDQVVADPLTGLANRTGLDAAITAATRRHEQFALLLVDLDDFKLINDAYGHVAGDAVLVEFGHHLRASVRSSDTCARIGGDEFAVLLLGAADPEVVAQRILVARPVRLGDDTVTVHASIGLTGNRPDDTAKDLMQRADLAMYAAKRLGTHTWMRHDPSMIDRRAMDAALAEELTGAAGRGELLVVYQPIVDIAAGTANGYEALVRWRHPTRGMVPPLDFIPAAERTGLIYDIGLHVLEQACADVAAAPGTPYVSVNLSPRQLQTPSLVHDVLAALRRSTLAPARLVLEVTESAIVDEQSGIATLHELRSHGIRIAVDDFGTGYSSLHYLTRLPVDILKIDRSFVAELDGTPTGAAITEAVIRLAQVLRLHTIAEGIETADQASELLSLGCFSGQGYLYAPPRPAEESLLKPVSYAQRPPSDR